MDREELVRELQRDAASGLRYLPGTSHLPRGAQVAPVVLLLLAAWAALGRCTPGTAHGSPLDCEGIRDADRRHLCRAIGAQRRSECELIRDADRRRFCRAIGTPRRSECELIRDWELRRECRARAKQKKT